MKKKYFLSQSITLYIIWNTFYLVNYKSPSAVIYLSPLLNSIKYQDELIVLPPIETETISFNE